MPINHIQFQRGMSITDFMSRYGTEAQCEAALFASRWPRGFRCPRCTSSRHYVVEQDSRKLFQCWVCRHQTSLTSGTMMDSTKLPLRTWFLAIFLISQAKTGLAALALKRHLGVNYRTAWLMNQKILLTMAKRDERQPLEGNVQVDDAYLGGERPGVGGRGSKNKVPFVAAVELSDEGHPLRVKLNAVPAFSCKAITTWAKANLKPGCDVLSDGLSCFAGVVDAGCAHTWVVVGDRKPRDLPQFRWVNTILGNVKTMISGAHKAFKFGKYHQRYLGAFSYRFNGRFDLRALVGGLIGHVARAKPQPERLIRRVAELAT
jgi:transposase-like protein